MAHSDEQTSRNPVVFFDISLGGEFYFLSSDNEGWNSYNQLEMITFLSAEPFSKAPLICISLFIIKINHGMSCTDSKRWYDHRGTIGSYQNGAFRRCYSSYCRKFSPILYRRGQR